MKPFERRVGGAAARVNAEPGVTDDRAIQDEASILLTETGIPGVTDAVVHDPSAARKRIDCQPFRVRLVEQRYRRFVVDLPDRELRIDSASGGRIGGADADTPGELCDPRLPRAGGAVERHPRSVGVHVQGKPRRAGLVRDRQPDVPSAVRIVILELNQPPSVGSVVPMPSCPAADSVTIELLSVSVPVHFGS